MLQNNFPLIVFDFDSTLINTESLEKLAEISLRNDPSAEEKLLQISKITDQSMKGDLDFGEALSSRLKVLKIKEKHIAELEGDLPRFITDSVQNNLPFFREHAEFLFVVSGGFSDYMFPVLEVCGLKKEHLRANRFLQNAAGDVTGYDRKNPLAHAGGKEVAVREILKKFPGPKKRLIVVGDGFTDYEARAAGLAEEFYVFTENKCRPEVVALADRRADNMEQVIEFINKTMCDEK